MSRKPETTGFWCGRLPHWEVQEGRYFVTIHLAGAIPPEGMQRIEAAATEVRRRAERGVRDNSMALMRTIFRDLEEWLDQTVPNSLLTVSPIADMVIDAIQHRHQKRRWVVYEFVLMPSHLHLFISILQGTLKESLEDFKRWTGHQAAKIVTLPNRRFWQDEWFDHWSRDDEQDERIAAYIRQNPVKAGLVANHRDWKYGSWSIVETNK